VKKITVLTIGLFSIGIIFALLIGHNYFTSQRNLHPHIISKERAIAIVFNYAHFSPQELANETTEAELLQAHLYTHNAFVIDPITLSAGIYPQVVPLSTPDVSDNQLYWQIDIKGLSMRNSFHEKLFFVDALNGTMMAGPE